MNPDLKLAFSHVKPLCDAVMRCPDPGNIDALNQCIVQLKKDALQEMQLYVLFPIAAHLKAESLKGKHEIQKRLVNTMKLVLEKVTVHIPDIFVKYHTSLLNLVFNKNNTGMLKYYWSMTLIITYQASSMNLDDNEKFNDIYAKVSENLLLSVVSCLTTLMLQASPSTRVTLFQGHVPLLVQTIFMVTYMAKEEKYRALRIESISCMMAYMAIHPSFTNMDHHILNADLEVAAAEMCVSILPGVVAALQDVATDVNNPGQLVIVSSLNAIHKIICLVMKDEKVPHKDDVDIEDFAKILKDKMMLKNVIEVEKKAKLPPKKTPEWYLMAAEKLKVVTKNLMSLQTHDSVKVRLELVVFCSRMLFECTRTMQPSIPFILEVLVALSNDEMPEVATYSRNKLNEYFNKMSDETKHRTLDSVSDSFLANLSSLPGILNNIDSSKKLAALNLVQGYLSILCSDKYPQRLSVVLSLHHSARSLCYALLHSAALQQHVSLLQHAERDISSPAPTGAPWCKLKHVDEPQCERRLQDICRLLGNAECADLIVDEFIDLFHDSPQDRKEIVYLLNWIGSAPKSDINLTKRIIDKYIGHEVWYVPLEVGHREMISSDETLDLSVYNPRAWDKDAVPGLFEGSVETRYTDISYSTPRAPKPTDPGYCATLSEAQNNMVLSCLLTEGLGMLAWRLMDDFQCYLLKTLCLVLERVGSKYELLHFAGLKAINDITTACGHKDVAELIRHNADYFTYQVTTRLKKSWNSQSALQILAVVMEYSDSSMLDCLYGIVSDVLVQSLDKYHTNDLIAYLQVFLTFVNCIQTWFPNEKPTDPTEDSNQANIDPLHDVKEYIKNVEISESLLNEEEGKSAEEMYEEDLKKKEEEDELNYDDPVTVEKPPLPQHIQLTVTILKRCLNFIPSKRRDEGILSLQIINQGLMILREYEDELLPLVHLVWSPLVARFGEKDPVVVSKAFDVLVTMADLSKDFIRSRTIKEVLPLLYKFLHASSAESHLKDLGSAYRSSHRYKLQVCVLTDLPRLVVDLQLEEEHLERALDAVDPYLHNKQPKPLQALAVAFFKKVLSYDHGAVWHHLSERCDNDSKLTPPDLTTVNLAPVVGGPYTATDKCLDANVKLIFDRK